MEDKKIRIAVAVVAVTLMGLIGIQLYLVSNSLALRKKELGTNMVVRLEKISKQMEDNLVCFEAFARVKFSPGEGFYLLKNKLDKEGNFIPVNKQHPADSIEMHYLQESGKKELYNFTDLKFSHPMDLDIIFKYEYAKDTGWHRYSGKMEPLEKLTVKNYRQQLSTKRPLKEFLDTVTLDSLIGDALIKSGVKDKFYYGVLDKDNKVQYASVGTKLHWLLKSEMRTSFFGTKYFNEPYTLIVYVPESAMSTLQAVWLVLLISVIIVLLLALSFRYFINVINRQKKLSEMKNDFIDNMTHEFKTPLTNISLALQNIDEHGEKDDSKLHRYLDIISEENERLRSNVERVLHIASSDKMDFELKKEMLDINDLIERVASTFRIQNHLAGKTIVTNLHAKPSLIMADEVHVTNVFFNLIDNAIKYSPGATTITISSANTPAGILTSIEDRGIGMNEFTQKRIFDKFYRASQGNVHDVKGFGLGLSYVKIIVDAHKAEIRVKSEPGKGSCFEIEWIN